MPTSRGLKCVACPFLRWWIGRFWTLQIIKIFLPGFRIQGKILTTDWLINYNRSADLSTPIHPPPVSVSPPNINHAPFPFPPLWAQVDPHAKLYHGHLSGTKLVIYISYHACKQALLGVGGNEMRKGTLHEILTFSISPSPNPRSPRKACSHAKCSNREIICPCLSSGALSIVLSRWVIMCTNTAYKVPVTIKLTFNLINKYMLTPMYWRHTLFP